MACFSLDDGQSGTVSRLGRITIPWHYCTDPNWFFKNPDYCYGSRFYPRLPEFALVTIEEEGRSEVR